MHLQAGWVATDTAHGSLHPPPFHTNTSHLTLHTSHLQVGRLWTSLADYYIRRGMFEKARDVYEEGLTSVITVHDFSLIFDAYTQVGLWEVRGGQ